MSIIITGANGYVGKSLCKYFFEKDVFFKTISRGPLEHNFHYDNNVKCDFSKPFNLVEDLRGSKFIFHLASCVHNKKSFSHQEYRIINIEASKSLAKQSVIAKIQRFIFFSSAAVFPRESPLERPFSNESLCLPETEYGKSKLAAENEIKNVCDQSELSYSIIRPPMIYGKDAPGNWNRILRFLSYKIPLPFGSIDNKRSFLFIGNLLSFIETLVKSDNAKDGTFLVSDDYDISTTQLINEIKKYNKYNAINFKMNVTLLSLIFRLLGLSNESNQLLKNMQLDVSQTKSKLNWKPPFNFRESIRESI